LKVTSKPFRRGTDLIPRAKRRKACKGPLVLGCGAGKNEPDAG